jgi:hypothetical protein
MWLAGCSRSPHAPPANPPFQGSETTSWLAYDAALPGQAPSDYFLSFEANARAHGCRTEHVGGGAHSVPRSQYQLTGDENRYIDGIVAACDEGTISLLSWSDDLVKVGCAKPTTQPRCDLLLQRIFQAR